MELFKLPYQPTIDTIGGSSIKPPYEYHAWSEDTPLTTAEEVALGVYQLAYYIAFGHYMSMKENMTEAIVRAGAHAKAGLVSRRIVKEIGGGMISLDRKLPNI